MNNSLEVLVNEWRRGVRRMLWLDFWEYGIRLFGTPAFTDASPVIQIAHQTQSLVSSDVVMLRVRHLYGPEWILPDGDTVRPERMVRTLLQHKTASERVLSVVRGLSELWGTATPFVLALPSPSLWGEYMKPPGGVWDIDRVAAYEADYLRGFAGSHLQGIVLEETQFNPSVLTSYQPIWNVAKHYGWIKGLEIPDAKIVPKEVKTFTVSDFWLFPQVSIRDLEAWWSERVAVGGGLTLEYWISEPAVQLPASAFGYGVIPSHASPEAVFGRLHQ